MKELITLPKSDIDFVFADHMDSTDLFVIIKDLYALVYPNFNDMFRIIVYPSVSNLTNQHIFERFYKHSEGIETLIAWMLYGFQTSARLPNWTADTGRIILQKDKESYLQYQQELQREHEQIKTTLKHLRER